MNNQLPAINGAYVGLLAASSAVVSKYSKRREPTFGRVPQRFEAPSLQDMPRLLDHQLDSTAGTEHRVARITSLATCQTLEAPRTANPFSLRPGGYAEQLTTRRERERMRERLEQTLALAPRRAPVNDTLPAPTMCRYCALFQDLLHDFRSEEVPIEILSHGARINSDFDPTTNISAASIDDFQLFLPQKLAQKAVSRSHPLAWKESAGEMFDKVQGARRGHPDWVGVETSEEKWNEEDAKGRRYIYEEAKFPWNEEVSSRVHNVLALDDFTNSLLPTATINESLRNALARDGRRGDSIGACIRGLVRERRRYAPLFRYAPSSTSGSWDPNEARVLSYRYSLEACLGSSYGVGWDENSGLDVDDGGFTATAVHYDRLEPAMLAHLTHEDLVHLAHSLHLHYEDRGGKIAALDLRTRAERLRTDDSAAALATKAAAVRAAAEALASFWGQDPWLVTISASKRLRYNLPRDGIVELWQMLTWLTPALLFTFINRSVCQLPNLLVEKKDRKQPPKQPAPARTNRVHATPGE